MSRVVLHYDNDSKIYFNTTNDALHHLREQGDAGVVDLKQEDNGKRLHTRKQLVDLAEKGN